MNSQLGVYVQYGCALCVPKEWINFDSSPTPRIQKIPIIGSLLTRNSSKFPKNIRYGDIVKGLPIEYESCNAIYCSHVLEHLALDEFRIALKNTFLYLRPGGIFRFVLPDLEQLTKEYTESDDPEASIHYLDKSFLGRKTRPSDLIGFLRLWLGRSERHLWMWDFNSMSSELKKVGFTNIRRAHFGDSQNPRFKVVEDEYRWQNNLGVECFRPKV